MDDLLKALVVACAPILTMFLIRLINIKAEAIRTNSDNSEVVVNFELIDLAEQAVIDVVVALNQTIVDAAKLEGTFDKQKQREVFLRAKNDIQMILSRQTKEAIRIIYGDFDLWLDTKIEAVVNENKIEIETLGV